MLTKINSNNTHTKNIHFGTFWSAGIRAKSAAVVDREISEQTDSLISAIFDLYKADKKRAIQKDDVLNDLFKNMFEKFGIKKIYEDLADGMVFDGKDKNYIFSIHGQSGLRVREQNKNNGFIENSVFIHDNKIVKTDTKDTVPDKVEYIQYKSNILEFEKYLKEIFDDIDFRLLQIKRKILAPDIQSLLSKADYPIYYLPITKIRDVNKIEETKLVTEKMKTVKKAKKVSETPKIDNPPANNEIIPHKKTVPVNKPVKTTRKPLSELQVEGIKSVKRKKRKLKLIGKREITAEKAAAKIPLLQRKGMLKDNDNILAAEITDLFNEVHETLKTIKNSLTRSKIKNGYPPLKMGKAGSRMLEFEGIGQNRENISVNILNDHYEKHLIINVEAFGGKMKNIIVNSKGEVLKRPSSVLEREWYIDGKEKGGQFYTQDEVDNLNFSQYLISLKKELELYKAFINRKINAISDKKLKHTTFEEGSVEKYNNLLNSVNKQYSYYKTNITGIFDKKERHAIKERFNIHTQKGHPSIILRQITPDGEDLHLSYPKINGEICTKILIIDKVGAIKNTLLVKENKLVKYEADNIHSRKRNDRGFYYYSQQEVDQSKLEEYLKIIEKHLKIVNNAIDNVKNS